MQFELDELLVRCNGRECFSRQGADDWCVNEDWNATFPKFLYVCSASAAEREAHSLNICSVCRENQSTAHSSAFHCNCTWFVVAGALATQCCLNLKNCF